MSPIGPPKCSCTLFVQTLQSKEIIKWTRHPPLRFLRTRAPFKKIARDINEDARNHARSLRGTPEFERSSNARKKVEMRFAHLKVQHGFERMRLRGLTGARDEFHLAAMVQNLKTLALRSLGPPTGRVCASIA